MTTPPEDLSFLHGKSTREEAAQAERSRRDAELEEMCRLRAEREGGTSGIESTRKRITALESKYGNQVLITDLDEWRAGQREAAEVDRLRKQEADQHLHSYQNNDVRGSSKKNIQKKRIFQRNHINDTRSENDTSDQLPVEQAPYLDQCDNIPHDTAESPPLRPLTYSRVDVKFSFGLVIRTDESGFDSEDLRDNKTLRKCMRSTSTILMDKMSSPPTMVAATSELSLPEAYYDPEVEPSLISIEEENEEGKTRAKGTKRTLVKASFPVFLRDGTAGKSGNATSAEVLKETKSTVFRALRAAVTGGSFLR